MKKEQINFILRDNLEIWADIETKIIFIDVHTPKPSLYDKYFLVKTLKIFFKILNKIKLINIPNL